MANNIYDCDEQLQTLFEQALDTLIEVGNGVTDEMLHEATDKLFKVRDILEKSDYFKLPYKVGDIVYIINGFKEIEEMVIEYCVIEQYSTYYGMIDDGEYDVREVYSSYEEAERALKERENNG